MLKAFSPLGGTSVTINDVSIAELSGRSLVSIAVPSAGLTALQAAIKKQLKLALPEPGKTTSTKTKNGLLIWTSSDQFLFAFDETDSQPAKAIEKLLTGKAYITDQSDAWITIRVSSAQKLQALERICPINLHPETFKVGMAARTMMEHLGVLIIKTGEDEFLLMSARSTAQSLLHAIETSAKNLA